MLLGHLAVPFILKQYLKAEFAPVAAGTFFPDVMDKTLQQLGLTRSGRTIAHTLLAVAASTLVLKTKYGQSTARDWLLGYLGHLICDWGGLVPWWYPFSAYDFEPNTDSIWQKLRNGAVHTTLVEVFLAIWAAKILADAKSSGLGKNGASENRFTRALDR